MSPQNDANDKTDETDEIDETDENDERRERQKTTKNDWVGETSVDSKSFSASLEIIFNS